MTRAWRAHYVILRQTPEQIILRDVGPWDRHPTITNAAEEVIEELDPPPGQRVFYWDSCGEFGEILVERGVFAGFAPAQPVGALE